MQGKTKPFSSHTTNNVYKPHQKKHYNNLLIYFDAGMMTDDLIILEKTTVNKNKIKICLGNQIKKKIVKFGERRETRKQTNRGFRNTQNLLPD